MEVDMTTKDVAPGARQHQAQPAEAQGDHSVGPPGTCTARPHTPPPSNRLFPRCVRGDGD